LGKKCGRCSTRYCGPECQKQHWDEGGHDKLCKKIKKGGGAEQYHADKKCAEAVAAAAVACAEDTKGQKCYICLEVVHARTGEGVVRGCGCGDRDSVSSPELGVAHVSCLVEQAKILFEEAEENKLSEEAFNARWGRWYTCSLCGQWHHGVVACALGWVCWKTYVGRPEAEDVHELRRMAMNLLGNGLSNAKHHEDALSVKFAMLAMMRRLGASEKDLLVVQGNLANTYNALRMEQDVYSARLKLNGPEHEYSLFAVNSYASALRNLRRFAEIKSLLRETTPVARRTLGESHRLPLQMRFNFALALYMDPDARMDEIREAVAMLEKIERITRRVFGGAHPHMESIRLALEASRALLRAGETQQLEEAWRRLAL